VAGRGKEKGWGKGGGGRDGKTTVGKGEKGDGGGKGTGEMGGTGQGMGWERRKGRERERGYSPQTLIPGAATVRTHCADTKFQGEPLHRGV